jgi:hypothetical protein
VSAVRRIIEKDSANLERQSEAVLGESVRGIAGTHGTRYAISADFAISSRNR